MNSQKVAAATCRGLLALMRLILAYSTAVLMGGREAIVAAMSAAAHQSHVQAFNIGPSPTSMNSANMPQSGSVIYYNSKWVKNLKAEFPAQRCTSRRAMPLKAGTQWRDYMYKPLAPNTNQASEGIVGSPIQISTAFTTYTLGQWADYINFSDFSLDTAIDPTLENVEKELAYRCGGTIQRLVLAQADFARTVDASVALQDAPTASTVMTKDVATQAVGSLRGRNVKGMQNMGKSLGGLIHPFFTADMLQDNTNNSYVDILKRYPEGQMLLKELPSVGDSEAKILEFGGVVWCESTALTTTANFLGSGLTAIRTYVIGEDGLISVDLKRPDKTNIGDGNYRALNLWRGSYARGSAFDAAGMIGGGTSYNVVGAWGLPPDTTMRLRAYDYVPKTT